MEQMYFCSFKIGSSVLWQVISLVQDVGEIKIENMTLARIEIDSGQTRGSEQFYNCEFMGCFYLAVVCTESSLRVGKY